MQMQLSRTDVGHQSILLNGFYELALSRHITGLAQSGGILVDVGANFGYYSILWLARQQQNKAVAFEAAPYNWEPLRTNIELNNLLDRTVLVQEALSDKAGFVAFEPHLSNGQTGWGGIALEQSENTIQIPSKTLDQYWAENYPGKTIAVLKIDVEGADTLVLQGAEQLLRERRIQHIFFEVNRPRMDQLGISPDTAFTLLNRHGYQVKAIDKNEMHACL